MTTKQPETLHIRVKWPKFTVHKNLFKHSASHIRTVVNKGVSISTIQLNRGQTMEQLKGSVNHELAHYFFGDFHTENFLSEEIFETDIRELIQPKNGMQKYSFAQEYRADWFIGLMTQEHNNFEYIKQALQQFDHKASKNHHPPLDKRINWLSRWINLKRAEKQSRA